jgi:mannose-6-phosphate isomerase-like protein (cupin superfamily)
MTVHDETTTETEVDEEPEQPGKRKITWYEADDAKELLASGAMTPTFLNPEVISAIAGGKLHLGNGSRVLFQDADPDGFSLVHAWFGENFPLPRHTHSGDCLYFVLRGELKMGSKTVKAGSGFFVPSNRPYTYRAGVGGVEVLEFRKVSTFDMITLDQDLAKWQSYVAIGEDKEDAWNETRPEWVDNLVGGVGVTTTDETE